MVVNAPIATPVNVVVVFIISVVPMGVNELLVELCHFVTLPVLPDKVKSEGVDPEQIVWSEETVPPTLVGSTTILPVAVFPEQVPPVKVIV